MENVGIFYVHLENFMAIWYVLVPFCNLVVIWYSIPLFWFIVRRKIWHPWYVHFGKPEAPKLPAEILLSLLNNSPSPFFEARIFWLQTRGNIR
jgi:hypothetical protein